MYIYVQWPLCYRTQLLCTTKAMYRPCVRHVEVMECHPCTNTVFQLLFSCVPLATCPAATLPFAKASSMPLFQCSTGDLPSGYIHLPRHTHCLYSCVPLATCPVATPVHFQTQFLSPTGDLPSGHSVTFCQKTVASSLNFPVLFVLLAAMPSGYTQALYKNAIFKA